MQSTFPKIRIVGCLFHFTKQIRFQLLKKGLFNSEYKENTEELLKDLSPRPFVYGKNNTFINDIFSKYTENSINDRHKYRYSRIINPSL